MGYNQAIRSPVGAAFKTIHTAGGIKVNYYVCTNKSTDPLTFVSFPAMPLHNTPSKKMREVLGGRFEEILQLGSSMYLISYGTLVDPTTGTHYTPTTDDYFQMLEPMTGVLETPVYYVQAVLDLSPVPFAWYLLCNQQQKIAAQGF